MLSLIVWDFLLTTHLLGAEVNMAKKKRKTTARRTNRLRVDSSIASAQSEIARVFDLPEGCIRLVNPGGRKARDDKKVGALLNDWNKS